MVLRGSQSFEKSRASEGSPWLLLVVIMLLVIPMSCPPSGGCPGWFLRDIDGKCLQAPVDDTARQRMVTPPTREIGATEERS